MSWALRQGGGAMAVTTLSTVVAFFAVAISQITPVRNFGVFMGGVLTFNYALVLTYFPSAVIIYHKYFQNKCTTNSKGLEKANDMWSLHKYVVFDVFYFITYIYCIYRITEM
jgi:predicted RND superfamily exporter protein